MNCRFVTFTISLLLCQVIASLSIQIQHPSLWVKSYRTLLFTPERNNQRENNWNYIASAQRTKAYKKSLIIQNIDGSVLQYDVENRSFVLTGELAENSNERNQMFVLTLNLQAVPAEHQRDQRIIQIIRRYIQEDKKNKNNFILIRAVYWPYYLCYNAEQSVYGAVGYRKRYSIPRLYLV